MIFYCLLMVSSMVFADAEVDAQLPNVQRDMSAPGFSQKAEKISPQAKQAIEQMRALSGNDPATEQAMMQLSADIFGNMKGKSMDQIQSELGQASSNPEGFMKSLTPEQIAKIQSLANKIENSKVPANPK